MKKTTQFQRILVKNNEKLDIFHHWGATVKFINPLGDSVKILSDVFLIGEVLTSIWIWNTCVSRSKLRSYRDMFESSRKKSFFLPFENGYNFFFFFYFFIFSQSKVILIYI
jgi:hypothetical protein